MDTNLENRIKENHEIGDFCLGTNAVSISFMHKKYCPLGQKNIKCKYLFHNFYLDMCCYKLNPLYVSDENLGDC